MFKAQVMRVIDHSSRYQMHAGNMNESPGYLKHIDSVNPVYCIGFIQKTMEILCCVCFCCTKLLVSSIAYVPKRNT